MNPSSTPDRGPNNAAIGDKTIVHGPVFAIQVVLADECHVERRGDGAMEQHVVRDYIWECFSFQIAAMA